MCWSGGCGDDRDDVAEALALGDSPYTSGTYSGRRHRCRFNIQVVGSFHGTLVLTGVPQTGAMHDAKAWRESGLAAIFTGRLHADGGPGRVRRRRLLRHRPARAPPSAERPGLDRVDPRAQLRDRVRQAGLCAPICVRGQPFTPAYCPPDEVTGRGGGARRTGMSAVRPRRRNGDSGAAEADWDGHGRRGRCRLAAGEWCAEGDPSSSTSMGESDRYREWDSATPSGRTTPGVSGERT